MKDVALVFVVLALVLLPAGFMAFKVATWNQCRSLGGPVAHCWQVVTR